MYYFIFLISLTLICTLIASYQSTRVEKEFLEKIENFQKYNEDTRQLIMVLRDISISNSELNLCNNDKIGLILKGIDMEILTEQDKHEIETIYQRNIQSIRKMRRSMDKLEEINKTLEGKE